ncbi:hypothetical protein ABW21_db0204962 [Orbilia brochopaga]|nr:hypothetical protein ABW21_db0204962 [Drechslerella brochopaga]
MPQLLDLATELLDHILGYALTFEYDDIPDFKILYCRKTKTYSRCTRVVPLAATCRLFYELNRQRMRSSSCDLLLSFKDYDTGPADDYNNEQMKLYEEDSSLRKCRNDWGKPEGSICHCGPECSDDDGTLAHWDLILIPCGRLLHLAESGWDKLSPVFNTLLPRLTNLTTASIHHDNYAIPMPAFIEGLRTLVHGCLSLKELFIDIAFSYQNHCEARSIEKLDVSKPYARLEVLRLQLRMEARWKNGWECPDIDGHPRLLTALHNVLELPTRTVHTLRYSKIGYPLDGYMQNEYNEKKFWSLPALQTLDIFLNKTTYMQLEYGNTFIFDDDQLKHLKVAVEYPRAINWAHLQASDTGNPGSGKLTYGEDQSTAECTTEDDIESVSSYGSCWEFDYESNIFSLAPRDISINDIAMKFPNIETLDVLNIGSRRREEPGLSGLIDELLMNRDHECLKEISTNIHLDSDGTDRNLLIVDPEIAKYEYSMGRRHLSCHSYPTPVTSHDAITVYIQSSVYN